MMDMKELARQLRLPQGENSKIVTEMMSKGNRPLYEFTFENLDLYPNAVVLEIGPADGHFVKELFELEPTIFYKGLDLSEEMVYEAKVINNDLVQKNKAEFIHGDVIDMPFKDHSFDRIFTINTLYFWTNPEKGISELFRVLKPGGKLLIVIRSRESMDKMPFTQFNFELYSEKELQQLLFKNGFSETKILHKVESIDLLNGSSAALLSFCAMGEKH